MHSLSVLNPYGSFEGVGREVEQATFSYISLVLY